jgi:glycogen operon protein
MPEATIRAEKPEPIAGDGIPDFKNAQESIRYAAPRMDPDALTVEPGRPHPLGATPDTEGVNFSVFTQYGTGVELLIFDEHDSVEPVRVIKFDPRVNKSYHFWHCYVRGLRPGAHYAYRVDGPWDPARGHRFNRNKVLIDPYGFGNTVHLWDRGAACGDGDNLDKSMRSVVIDARNYDWEGDQPLRRPMNESIIYELHVGGFTNNLNSGTPNAGTFRGVIDKIPYLKELGVTAVELLPVMQFDSTEVGGTTPDGRPLSNYWGYSTIGFFAPEESYCMAPTEGAHLNEFRDMVKALHKAGIEVILDVVFNHTSEGNHQGPTINLKGFDNSTFYHLVPWDKQYYMDYSGCGNTVNCNHPIVEKFIVDCLEFWAREMHVDGFRFDEGSILSRGEDGAPMAHPPVIWQIELSEALADTKIIAEAWDAAGLYQIGYFPGYRWAEWNGKYRDDIRKFVKGDAGMVGAVANRLAGSADIYQSTGHLPTNSVNFITCHDGFTLNDLVSYNEKHNWANNEGNRDGVDDNYSWNCGAEGPAGPEIEAFRDIQVKNFAALLLLSQGVPMITMGDEIRRGQGGNNNVYCQDNELAWMNWDLLEQNKHIFRFFSKMIAFRKKHPTIHRARFFEGEQCPTGLPDISWHGCALHQPGWHDPHCRVLGMTLGGVDPGEPDFHVMMNMGGSDLSFELPHLNGKVWKRKVDTSQPSPWDFTEDGQEPVIEGGHYLVNRHSVVVLVSEAVTPEAKAAERDRPRETEAVVVETPEGAQVIEVTKAVAEAQAVEAKDADAALGKPVKTTRSRAKKATPAAPAAEGAAEENGAA